MRTTSIKFSGLSSGLDTESIISSLILPQKTKVESAVQDKTLLQWRNDTYKDINTKIYNFYTKTVGTLRLVGSFNTIKTHMSTTNAIVMGQDSSPPQGTHSVEVKEIAQGVMLASKVLAYQDSEGNAKLATSSTKLTELGLLEGDGITVGNGISEATIRVGDVKLDATGNPVVDKEGNSVRVETINDLIEQLQQQLKDTDIRVSFDNKNGSFMLSTTKTGKNQLLQLQDANGGNETLSKLGIQPNSEGSYEFQGKDAHVIYNGTLDIYATTNAIEVNGLKFTVVEKTSTPITIIATQDEEATSNLVTEFVKEYNTLIEELNLLINTKPSNEYKPLTSEQKESMSDTEIEKWENKAKEGLLYNDPTAKALLDAMRNILGEVTGEGEYNSLNSIGVKTSSWKEKGKLSIDEHKLKEAIQRDSSAITRLFTDPEKGIAVTLYKDMASRFRSSSIKSANMLFNDKVVDQKITEMSSRIKELEDRMYTMESLYFSRFTAMEKAMSQLNSQMAYLTQQMG